MKLVHVKSVSELLFWWPHFMESLDEINKLQPFEDYKTTYDSFFKVLLRLVDHDDASKVLIIVTSDEGEYAGHVSAERMEVAFRPPALHIITLHSNNKVPKIGKMLVDLCATLAKERNISHLTFTSSRFNGSSFRVHEDILGFRRVNVFFSRSLK